MIVITLTKVPASLRGDLTKWCQEIQTGVYVGNFSARIRDQLWERILRDIGHGQATMAYNAQNELGYQFRTTSIRHEVVDYDGIPLLMRLKESKTVVKLGFSRAAKMHRARMSNRQSKKQPVAVEQQEFVAIDVETTGLNVLTDHIIAVGAVKSNGGVDDEQFYRLVQSDKPIPHKIAKLTGLSDELIGKEGFSLSDVLKELIKFIGKLPLVGYNLGFDDGFIALGLQNAGLGEINNARLDLLPVVRKADKFLDNYRLETVLGKYDIVNAHPHNALADAQATMELARKLKENGDFHF